jgi:tRNA threonylcarbamoyladenosine biosynthesis protein TsaB
MKILAVETSAVAASCCICEDGKLVAQSFQNNGLTHSRTLMPMIVGMLENTGLTVNDMDALAVAVGPGSFTGLRIGVSAVKGLAWAAEKPVCAVSTLEGMAWNLGLENGAICCAMDARRKQVYNALFRVEHGQVIRETEDRAIALEELFQNESLRTTPYVVVGDGAKLCYEYGLAQGAPLTLAPAHLVQQSAWGVAQVALGQLARGEAKNAQDLAPNYLRLSQAERERLEREKAQK